MNIPAHIPEPTKPHRFQIGDRVTFHAQVGSVGMIVGSKWGSRHLKIDGQIRLTHYSIYNVLLTFLDEEIPYLRNCLEYEIDLFPFKSEKT